MLNRDINARFEDWLLSPAEGLDFEAKCWLDMEETDSRGILAKALIALENHGGGYLVIGYEEDDEKRLRPDPKRPESLEQYNSDAINAIVKRCAEPSFHVEVTFQRHPETQEEFPLLRVAGRSRVPVRSSSSTPKSLRENIYYVRKPGPESEGPKSAAEWDHLMRRCILNQREEIVGVLRAFLPSDGGAGLPATDSELLRKFTEASLTAWRELNASLGNEHAGKIKHGHYYFSARVSGTSKALDASEILKALEQAHKYTGWPALAILHQADTRPKMVGGGLQAWTAKAPFPSASCADFWRITPAGEFFLLRGYDEDDLEASGGPNQRAAGTGLEPTLPVWRLGEFLLRLSVVASAMFEPGFEVSVECQWTGLKGRKTFSFGLRRFFGSAESAEETVTTSGKFSQAMLQDLPADVVKQLTAPLYLHFDMLKLPDSFYTGEMDNMRNGRG
jgi:hypothetical protein